MRLANRVLCAGLALALLVGGLVVAAEILLAALRRGPWLVPHDRWQQWATTTTWSDRGARVLFLALLGAGLVLLTVEWWRRRPSSLALAPGGGEVTADLDRRGVERWLGDRVGRVEGLSEARAEVGSRVVRIRADSLDAEVGPVQQRTRDALGRHLEELALARSLRMKVDVRQRRVS